MKFFTQYSAHSWMFERGDAQVPIKDFLGISDRGTY